MPKPGRPSEIFCSACAGCHHLVVVLLQLQFQQRLQFVRLDVVADHQAQAVGDEVHQVVVGEDLRVLAEDVAGGRGVHVRLQRDEALAARLVEQLVDQRQHVQVVAGLVPGALERGRDGGEGGLDRLHRRADQERAERRAADDDQLVGLPQRRQLAVRGDVTAEHAGDDHDKSDDDEHGRGGGRRCIPVSAVRRQS